MQSNIRENATIVIPLTLSPLNQMRTTKKYLLSLLDIFVIAYVGALRIGMRRSFRSTELDSHCSRMDVGKSYYWPCDGRAELTPLVSDGTLSIRYIIKMVVQAWR